jgi:hypothetical protein
MKKNKQASDVHAWRFFRAGGFDGEMPVIVIS